MPRIGPKANQPYVPKLSKDEQRALLQRGEEAARELLARRKARKSTIDFIQYCKPKYVPGAPHYEIAAALDEVIEGKNDRLMILAAPRHGKSELGTRTAPALYLGRYPDREVMAASFDAQLADEFGRDVRDLILGPRYHALFPKVALAEDSKAKGRWHTKEGGAFLSAGIGDSAGGGSGITGRGADLLTIDDPFKDRSSAESVARRKHVWDWYKSTAYTRLSDHGAIILINTRWHEDDLAGRLLEEEKNGGDKWKVVNLSCADPITGEPVSVWPERFPVHRLRRIMMALGGPDSRDWLSLYGQRPTAPKGTLFKIEFLSVLDAVPVGGDSVRAWDLAATKETGQNNPSWTVGVKMTRLTHGGYLIENVVRFRGAPEEVERAILNTAHQDGYSVRIGLPQDPGQAGKSQVQNLTKMLSGFNVESSPESGDKTTRAGPFIAQSNVGNVAMLSAPWNRAYTDELAAFPSGAHEDQVDASSRAFSMLIGDDVQAVWEKLGSMA